MLFTCAGTITLVQTLDQELEMNLTMITIIAVYKVIDIVEQ